ncbi:MULTISPECIES: efflux RND transporter periplasmic adaptor subunit [unclassified Luteimonas]|uniref:efflux RND transporter periplasmic adaptor subunit n=1 Tax=unclassified Luteimonas TaxID=2629088 RepID=UPI001602E7FC|nr:MULTISPECIES: efflux RND transporter periplasmic adaptor subunit [unclassified Luteimonas]MBB1472979.1 efflux RND transporter periplasmic adaptor subunit [Luteimonas sp. MC1782]MBB6598320.1 efflux RND transporter periplasmic adaptor subunit [Luteimonas sp. MC1825]QOC88527.1 efflux RND transporter periplasmic adaptor subunit [Luteimonas sp. MC1825]
MDQRSRIRDTASQDQVLATPRGALGGRKPWLVGGAVMIALVAAIAWLASGWSAGGRSYDASRLRVAEVTRGELVRDLSADGRVIAANSPTLYAIAAGTVALKVVAGDVVKQGQELAVIDSPELRSRLVQEESALAGMEAEASRALLDARLAKSDARKQLDQAGIDRTAAERDLQRYQRGFDGGAVPQVDVARAQDALKKADLGLSAARQEFSLSAQGAELDARNKRLMADRQRAVAGELARQVDALTLRAPFDGQVGQVQVPQGTSVAANGPVLGVVDLSVFELEIKVPESFARDLAIGMPAQVTSTGKTFPAEVSAVSPEVVNGEVNARLRFAENSQPPGLRQNQRLSARIVLDTRPDTLMVERGPFLEQDGGRFAYVVQDGSAVRRPIQTGVSSLGAVEILSGLEPGERVVVSGADQFDSAERVRISGD